MRNLLLKRARSIVFFVGFLFGNLEAFGQATITLETLTDPSIQCTGSQVNLSWTANALENNFTQIDLSTNGGNTWMNQGQVAKTATSFTVTLPTSTIINCFIRVINNSAVDTTATFAIAEKPGFRTQMNPNYDRCVGTNISFAPEISPAGTYVYQWYKDGQPLQGQTFPTYSKNNLQAGDGGIYTLQVIGCETVISSPAVLAINAGTTITANPSDVTGCAGKEVALSVVATGANLTYQWKKNGNNIAGATKATYTIASMNQTDAGTYTCTVSGSCGSPATSNPAIVSVTGSPITSLNFTNDSTVCSGTTLRLLASGTNGEPFTFIWKKDGSLLSESGPELTFNSISQTAAGTYSVQVKNACDEIAEEKTVKISVFAAPNIFRQTSDTTVYRGFATRLRVVTSGEALVYAWYKNDVLLPKDTTAILTISQTQFADSGIYHCVLTNSCGTVESDPIKVSVIQPPAGPKLTLSVNAIDFGCIDRNTVKDSTLTALIKNDGETQLTVSSITINGSQKTNFSIIEGAGSFNLDAGATRTVKLQFKPEDKKYNTAELVIASNSTVGAETLLPLSGTSCFEEVLTSSYEYGSIENGSTGKDTIIHVINSGTKAMRVDSVTVSGSSFTIVNPATLPLTVNASDTMSITVKFNNANAGTYTETLNVKTGVGMYAYTLTGTVKQPSDIIELGEERGFAVYPNPADNMLSLSSKFEARIRDMKIIDKLGNTVGVLNSSEIAPGSTLNIQVNALPQGAYYLMVTERNEQTSAIPFLIVR
jgi:hypothetical protein